MKFESLLKISKIEEEELKIEINSIQERLATIDGEITKTLSLLKECEKVIDNPSNFILSISSLNHISVLQQKINDLNNRKKDVLIEFNKINNKLIDKKAERKGFEKLINKQIQQIKKEQEKKEQIFLDDLNSKD